MSYHALFLGGPLDGETETLPARPRGDIAHTDPTTGDRVVYAQAQAVVLGLHLEVWVAVGTHSRLRDALARRHLLTPTARLLIGDSP